MTKERAKGLATTGSHPFPTSINIFLRVDYLVVGNGWQEQGLQGPSLLSR